MGKEENSAVESPPYSKEEMEGDILERLCLWNKQNIPATEINLCRDFGIPKITLTATLRKMLEKGYIEPYKKNEAIRLTLLGVNEGNEYLYRHNSISQFLQFVGVKEEVADQDACRAEHIFSDQTVEALCSFVNADYKNYVRKIRNTELTDRYEPGTYQFDMQIYSMEQCRPRKFREEYFDYTGNIFLEIGREGWFELEYAGEKWKKKLWYKNAGRTTEDEWIEAPRGERGERIPANAFEFVIKYNEVLMEGHLLIALTGENEKPDIWNSCQLEVEIW